LCRIAQPSILTLILDVFPPSTFILRHQWLVFIFHEKNCQFQLWWYIKNNSNLSGIHVVRCSCSTLNDSIIYLWGFVTKVGEMLVEESTSSWGLPTLMRPPYNLFFHCHNIKNLKLFSMSEKAYRQSIFHPKSTYIWLAEMWKPSHKVPTYLIDIDKSLFIGFSQNVAIQNEIKNINTNIHTHIYIYTQHIQ
jgi:hypothetical protein